MSTEQNTLEIIRVCITINMISFLNLQVSKVLHTVNINTWFMWYIISYTVVLRDIKTYHLLQIL